MAIVVAGVDKVLARFAATVVAGEVAVGAGVDVLGNEVLRIAQDVVPQLTGHLHDNIFYERTGPESGRVYTDVVYAGQVEYGGLHNPPEPYMRPGADLADTEVVAASMKGIVDSA